jgi:uncharacterized repeat protein (TIGR01451 family)
MKGLFTSLLMGIALLAAPLLPNAAAEEAKAAPQDPWKLEISRLKPTILTFKGITKVTIYDSDIASAMILPDDRIALEGRSAGTTTVEVYRLVDGEEKAETLEVTVVGTAATEEKQPAPAEGGVTATEPGKSATPEGTQAGPTEATPAKAEGDGEKAQEPEAKQPAAEPVAPGGGTAEGEDSEAVSPAEEVNPEMGQPAVTFAAGQGAAEEKKEEKPADERRPFAEESNPVLWLGLSVDQREGEQGEVLSYAVTVGNRGPVEATDVFVRDVLPTELEYVDGSATAGGRYSATSRELEWSLPKLAAGEELSAKLAFQARLAEGVSASATIHNVATAECKQLDTMIASNTTSHKMQTSSLVALFALPDVILARKKVAMPMLDVRGEEYQRAVDRLEGLGIVRGYPDRTFLPDADVSRAESTKMVVLASNLKEFRDRTQLTYVLSREAKVTVKVLDQNAAPVRVLVENEQKAAGDHALTWDGLSNDGVPVPAGTYEYQVTAVDGEEHQTKLASNLTVVPVQDLDIKGAPTFKDVVPTDWYAGYVAEAENRQYVRGYPDGTFGPARKLTRAEATAIVVRALGMEKQAQQRLTGATGFVDAEDIPAWANGYVAVASTEAPKAGDQLIIGYPGNTFQAQKLIKRTEAAAMVERFIDRDVPNEVTVAGAVAPGASVTLNGRVIKGGAHGRFRERIAVVPGELTTIAVLMR